MISGWLIRKWCEWSHVHSWTSVFMKPASERSASLNLYMRCVKCERVWNTPNLDQAMKDIEQ